MAVGERFQRSPSKPRSKIYATDWITREREMHAISKFLSSNFRRRRAMKQTQHILRCIISIQAVQRGRSVRRAYSSLLVSRLEETVRFQGISPGSRAAVASAGQS